jgi:hypothetical protein
MYLFFKPNSRRIPATRSAPASSIEQADRKASEK